ncbi:probable basic-leucine zipper transcription factor S [Microplitis mediator]|uniref:probable basic-leucine zipper transcription factor S n=1 Tax=Microplitis mediator TaxID=375433 RepID=UPI002553DF05|nr:probable basic-leucine zipper transcription factor S [Microplitis mediator]
MCLKNLLIVVVVMSFAGIKAYSIDNNSEGEIKDSLSTVDLSNTGIVKNNKIRSDADNNRQKIIINNVANEVRTITIPNNDAGMSITNGNQNTNTVTINTSSGTITIDNNANNLNTFTLQGTSKRIIINNDSVNTNTFTIKTSDGTITIDNNSNNLNTFTIQEKRGQSFHLLWKCNKEISVVFSKALKETKDLTNSPVK